MTVWFPDVSSWQAGLMVQPGTVAVIAKATEGTDWRDPQFKNFKAQAAAQGSIFSGYHFLKAGNAAAQAANYWNYAGTTPCMVDTETEGSSNPTVDDCCTFIRELTRLGGRVWADYFPYWYWRIVGGDLSRITALGAAIVSSHYTTYSDSGPGWQPYGGASPIVWQYANNLVYGGKPVDFNAFKGTVAELSQLVNGKPGITTPVVSLQIVQMCARNDPHIPNGQTTNFANVYPVQRGLIAKNLLDDTDKAWTRGAFGTYTRAAYSKWQQSLGYGGVDADGIPGDTSLRRLATETGIFNVIA